MSPRLMYWRRWPEALVVAVQVAPTAEEVEAETEEAEAEAGVVRDEKTAAES